MMSMTNNDQERLLWDDCGISDFGLCTILKLFRKISEISCTPSKCATGLRHTPTLSYLPLITNHFPRKMQEASAYYFINFGRYSWVLVKGIVGNCGSAVRPIESLLTTLKFLPIVILHQNFSEVTYG